jgi:hypothetical protein
MGKYKNFIYQKIFNILIFSKIYYKIIVLKNIEFYLLLNHSKSKRVIYKYILITQLEAFRRNETGAMVMRNFDLGIESVNTIFGRLCR